MANNRPRKPFEESTRKVSRDINLVDPLAKWINSKVEIEERLSPSVIRKIAWIMLLVIIYIYFQHNFEGLIRKLNKSEKLVKAQRAAFISHKAKYMFASKQSEIVKKLEGQGFETEAHPPIKIEVNK